MFYYNKKKMDPNIFLSKTILHNDSYYLRNDLDLNIGKRVLVSEIEQLKRII